MKIAQSCVWASFAFLALLPPAAQAVELRLVQTTVIPGISGDVDHMAVDTSRQLLFLAAEDNGTLRVIDLKTGKLRNTIKGFKTPHSILCLPGSNELYVTDGTDSVSVLDATSFAIKKRIPTTPGADSIGVDAAHHLLYAVTGGKDVSMTTSKLTVIDTQTAAVVREIPISASHVEAMVCNNPVHSSS